MASTHRELQVPSRHQGQRSQYHNKAHQQRISQLAQDELGKTKEYSKDVDMKTSRHKTVIYMEGLVKQLERNETQEITKRATLDRLR